jgi:hypothetical protein
VDARTGLAGEKAAGFAMGCCRKNHVLQDIGGPLTLADLLAGAVN